MIFDGGRNDDAPILDLSRLRATGAVSEPERRPGIFRSWREAFSLWGPFVLIMLGLAMFVGAVIWRIV
jgi:hypothetical protein